MEDVPFADVVLRALDHAGELRLRKARRELGLQRQGGEVGTGTAGQKVDHPVAGILRLCVGGFDAVGVGEVRAGDDLELLLKVVEHDDLVEQHQVDIAEVAVVQLVLAQARLGVFDVVVSEVSDKAAGERRHARHGGAGVAGMHVADGVAGMLDVPLDGAHRFALCALADAEQAVCAGQLHGWVAAKERIAPPGAPLLGAFEQKAVAAYRAQRAQRLHRREPVRQQLLAYGHAAIRSGLRISLHRLERWEHRAPP